MELNLKRILIILGIIILLALVFFGCTEIPKESITEDEQRAEAEIIALEEGKQIDDNFNIVGNAIQTYANNLKYISCSDSDRGKNYDVYGEVTLKYSYRGRQTTQTFKDRCYKNNFIFEYYCNKSNRIALATYKCPNGCENEACKKDEAICEELIKNHNELKADRINLIFVLLDFPNKEYIVEGVKENLGFDNGTQIFHIAPYDYFSEKENQWVHVNESNELFFTMFATEPLKSNKDKFNLWYYYLNTNYSESEVDNFLTKHLDQTKQYFSLCNMKYVTAVIIRAHPLEDEVYNRQSATLPSFFNSPEINKSSIKFGIFYDYYGLNSSGTILSSYNEKTSYLWMHESAHSFFGLTDEYTEEYENPSFGYPTCAQTLSEAKLWWGNFENQIDSNYYTLNQVADDFYNSNPQINIRPSILCTPEEVNIGYIYGGCRTYLDSTKVIKPNRDSFMVRASNCPIPGTVNRERMEKVLGLFSGK
jgi:hypothetical protein